MSRGRSMSTNIISNSLEGRLLLAVPKKGRLHPNALDVLSGSDIKFRREHRLDFALVKNHPIALIFLPAADIPLYVGEGRVDLAITGRDQVAEHAANGSLPDDGGVEEILDCDFGQCKLQVQVPEKGDIHEAKALIGKNVLTSFVGLTEKYFAQLEGVEIPKDTNGAAVSVKDKLKTRIKYVSGGVEMACALGGADAIVDLVDSGETMRAHGLKAISTVLETTAVLIKSKHPSNPKLVDQIASRIKGIIDAHKYVLCQYNVERANLAEAVKLTPGRQAPSMSALEKADWVAVSSMVLKSQVADVMDGLKAVGARDVLTLEISNSRVD